MNASQLTAYVKDAKNNAYLQDVAGASASDNNVARYTKTTNTAYYIPDDFAHPDGTDTDWQDLIFSSAPVQSYNASLSGGSENINYYVSGGYYNQRGIVAKSGIERYSFRVNLEGESNFQTQTWTWTESFIQQSGQVPGRCPLLRRSSGYRVFGACYLANSKTVQCRRHNKPAG